MPQSKQRQGRGPGLGTRCVHGDGHSGGRRRPAETSGRTGLPGESVALPIHQTSTFRYSTPQEMIEVFREKRPAYLYTRYGNPTLAAVEGKIASLEGLPRALLFSSGMAAISTTFLHFCRQGDLVAAQRDLYGGTQALLSRVLPGCGIRVEVIDVEDKAAFKRVLRRRPKLFYFESPTNPLLRIPDGPELCRQAHDEGVLTVVDSTFGTPVLQQPGQWGVDLVVHSGTKFLGGHSDLVSGVVVGKAERIEALSRTRRLLGGVPEPLGAYLLDRGLKSLEVRVLRQSATALDLSTRLTRHPKVRVVHYPGLSSHPQHERACRLMHGGFGGVFSFEARGGLRGAVRCMEGFRWISLASSLGGAETLASHPATSSHASLSPVARRAQGIGPGLLRVAVGLESAEDLWADLERGLRRV